MFEVIEAFWFGCGKKTVHTWVTLRLNVQCVVSSTDDDTKKTLIGKSFRFIIVLRIFKELAYVYPLCNLLLIYQNVLTKYHTVYVV